jgi:hypothetical protein
MVMTNKEIGKFDERTASLLYNRDEFLKNVSEEIKPQFEGTTDLRTFLNTTGKLTREEMLLIVEQAQLSLCTQ